MNHIMSTLTLPCCREGIISLKPVVQMQRRIFDQTKSRCIIINMWSVKWK